MNLIQELEGMLDVDQYYDNEAHQRMWELIPKIITALKASEQLREDVVSAHIVINTDDDQRWKDYYHEVEEAIIKFDETIKGL